MDNGFIVLFPESYYTLAILLFALGAVCGAALPRRSDGDYAALKLYSDGRDRLLEAANERASRLMMENVHLHAGLAPWPKNEHIDIVA